MSPISKNAGFSLIEMAVVLVITGLILGTVIGAMNVQITGQRIKQTQERQQVIKEALINFVLQNSRLPCPALNTLPDTDVNAGNESCSPTVNSIDVPSANSAYFGAVPWKALGIPAESAKDAYGRRFTFVVTGGATSLGPATISSMMGNLSFANENGAAINACSLTPCDKLGVATIISHGPNGFGGFTGSGSVLANSADANELENSSNNNLLFIEGAFTQQGYDDIVLWLKPSELLGGFINSGAVKDFRAVNNERFEQVLVSLATSAVRQVEGCGVGTGNDSYELATLPATVQDSGGADYLDVWGTAINVSSSTITTFPYDFCADSTNTFVLTSAGPDANLATTADNQSRTITVNEFIRYAMKLN